MIINFILFILTEIINGAVAILPIAVLPSWITTTTETISTYFINWGFIFPISSFLLLLGFFILFELSILTLYGVLAIIKLVRGSG